MAITKRLRFEILRRDGHTCRYCGQSAPDVKLTVDHVNPVALGGSDKPDNLVTACVDCNRGKSSIPADAAVVANVANDALRWVKAIETVAWQREQAAGMAQEAVDIVGHAWAEWRKTDACCEKHSQIPRPQDWLDTVRRLYLAGLGADTMRYFVGLTMRKPTVAHEERWTYFCGCCWRELDAIQEGARRSITEWAEQ